MSGRGGGRQRAGSRPAARRATPPPGKRLEQPAPKQPPRVEVEAQVEADTEAGTEVEAAAPPDTAPVPLRVACVIIVVEAVALLVAGVIVVVKSATETAHSVLGALLLAGCALCGVAVLAFCARGLLRLRPAARTPVVVLELLALPVSWGLFQGDKDYYAAPMLAAALVVLYLLFVPPVRAVLDRPDPVR